jgi:transposase
MRVRRFRCEGVGCPRLIFAETLPDVAPAYARRTSRCSTMLLSLALSLGGEAAARLLPVLGLAASPTTLLRLLTETPAPQFATPRVLGVDDWALRRGHVYGTILVDLETHKVIELLPDRTVETLAEWLRQHPGVEIVSRDRSGAYAQAIAEGAPDAIQIADRWHLLKNNLEALERALRREHPAMVAAASPPPVATAENEAPASASAEPTPLSMDAPANDNESPSLSVDAPGNDNKPVTERKPYESTAREMGIYEKVQALGGKGLSVYQISKKTGFSKVTVRKYLEAKSCPHRATRRTKISGRSQFDQHLRQRWQQGCTDAKVLWQELQAMGYSGTLRTVQRHVADWRTVEDLGVGLAHAAPRPAAPPSAREARWWLLLPTEKLTTEQAAYVARLLEVSSEVQRAQKLAKEFRRLMCEHDEPALDPWLESAAGSGLPAFQSFAAGLREDLAAVRAALSLPWSQGQTEGQVNKLKLVKRQGYGRASVALLRRRLVA